MRSILSLLHGMDLRLFSLSKVKIHESKHLNSVALTETPSPSSTYDAPTRFVSRLGAHHFAHLRAVAEGLDIADSARRYLGIGHGHEARSAHLQTVESVRAIARRRRSSQSSHRR